MANGQTLNGSSCVHLANLYCVEWNLKVMDVGKVCRPHLPSLLALVKAEVVGEM